MTVSAFGEKSDGRTPEECGLIVKKRKIDSTEQEIVLIDSNAITTLVSDIDTWHLGYALADAIGFIIDSQPPSAGLGASSDIAPVVEDGDTNESQAFE